MKKNMKRIAALALVVLLLCLTLCACGAKKPKGTYDSGLGKLVFSGKEVTYSVFGVGETGTYEMKEGQVIITFEDNTQMIFDYNEDSDTLSNGLQTFVKED